jgi:hypothetical protein
MIQHLEVDIATQILKLVGRSQKKNNNIKPGAFR